MSRIPSILTAALVLAAAAQVSPSAALAQPRCEAPRVLVVVDRSSSMSAARAGTLPSGGSKWQVARTAVEGIVDWLDSAIDFGLAIYPAADRMNTCEPGAVTLDVGPNSASSFMAAFPADDPPYAGNWTATSQTLDVVADYAPMVDTTRDRHVVLITDGEQCCFAGGSTCIASQRFWPIDSVMRLRAMGIYVHVIGFGAAVDALTLNRAAVAGGTAFAGCAMDGEDPMDPNNCYVQANDLTDLSVALEDIARLITDEMCDGFDNDCDGLVDEDFDVDADAYTTCGSDPSVPGTPLDRGLVDCDDANGAVHPGAAELCNGIDDDCDGVVDPGCECVDGDSRACGSDVGVCVEGTQRCVDGAWDAACDGEVAPLSETCDGVDSDCDGSVDEDAWCEPGSACVEGACAVLTPPPMQSGGCCTVAAGSRGPSRGMALGFALGLVALGALRRGRRGPRGRRAR